MTMTHSILGGRYELLSRIGAGGMATVHRARDTRLLRDVAVKILNEKSAGDSGALMFHREARAVAGLRHEHIVQVYDYSGANEQPTYLVMELVDGKNLDQLMKDKGELPELVVGVLAWALAAALAHAHEHGVMHRDLKPANVMIEASGRILLADFGVAKAFRDPDQLGATVARAKTQLVGTPMFMAPEQVLEREVGPHTDVFAFGSLLHCMIAGDSPFAVPSDPVEVLRRIVDVEHEPVETTCARVGAELQAIVMRCLQKEIKLRPTAAGIFAELDGWLRQRGVVSYRRLMTDYLAGRDPEPRAPEPASSRLAVPPSPGAEQTLLLGPERGGWSRKGAERDRAPARDVDDALPTETLLRPGLVVPVAAWVAAPAAGAAPQAAPAPVLSKNALAAIVVVLVFCLISVAAIIIKRERGSTIESVASESLPATALPGYVPPGGPLGQSPPPPPPAPSIMPPPPPSLGGPDVQPFGAEPQTGAVLESEVADKIDAGLPQAPRKSAASRSGREPGTLEFRIRPWGTVTVDGLEKGNTPVLRVLTLPPGRHAVVVTHPALGKVERSIVVRAGERQVMDIDLRR
ncbi:MAG: serine/threonine protein kinase [Deltaproteobacteria bacterium]|nr:serine/threonine protein kinase [Deltaproteobacteria bacterium]